MCFPTGYISDLTSYSEWLSGGGGNTERGDNSQGSGTWPPAAGCQFSGETVKLEAKPDPLLQKSRN